MTKLILINGPIGCGKTELVKHIASQYNIVERKCKDKLFTLTMEFFCVEPNRFWEIYHTRELKELPQPEFVLEVTEYNRLCEHTGKKRIVRYELPQYVEISIREAMIYVSECLCKPAFGQDYFGVARAKALTSGIIAVDDSAGFYDELQPSIDTIGAENMILIRVHGRGTFEGDSRSYVYHDDIQSYDVFNDRTEIEFKRECMGIIENFIGEN